MALKYFEDISTIPRASRNEAAAAAFVMDCAEKLGLYAVEDKYHNVLVRKAATPGFEHCPAVLLQSQDSSHDFAKEGIELILEDNILRANGTTLGGDDAKGVAPMLALMDKDSDEFNHPALEFLFTTGEEIGFVGAMACELYPQITARKMINIDAGPEGRVAVSSAGSQEITIGYSAKFEPVEGDVIAISVRGLTGGHSGMKIVEEKGNSNKILGRVLHNLEKVVKYRLCTISGGASFNAIPREADAVIAVEAGKEDIATLMVQKIFEEVKVELSVTDPDVAVYAKSAQAERMLSAESTKKIVDFIFNAPNGVYMMSKDFAKMPLASANMGVTKTAEDSVTITLMTRFNLRSAGSDLADHICSVALLCGADTTEMGEWLPEWAYNPSSELRDVACQVYKRKYNKEMAPLAGHAGLEVGVFCDKLPDVDVIALGATGGNTHTVKEWLDLDSFARVYDYLKELIAELAK